MIKTICLITIKTTRHMKKLIEAIRRRDTIEAVEKNVISKKIDI